MKKNEDESQIVVSVVVITYNQENTISQTIEYILNQKCSYNFEIIIGEDCSQDNTINICNHFKNKYPDKIKLISHEKNLGVVKNWLLCINHTSGKYLMTCAGDDYWHNNTKMQLQVDYMESNPNCGVLHTDYAILDSNTNKTSQISLSENNAVIQGHCQKSIFDGTLKICAPTACVRKQIFDRFVPVDVYFKYNFPIEDWPTWVILSHYSEINYLPVSTVTYRRGHESLSNLKNYDKVISKYEREKIMYKVICEMFPGDLFFNEREYDGYVNTILLNLAFTNKDFENAKKYGKSYNYSTKKTFFSHSQFLFWIYCILKK